MSHPENLQVKNTGTGNPADAPWTAYVPDFDGRGPGNMFLNSPHARFAGTFDQIATAGKGSGYASNFLDYAEAANAGSGCTNCMRCSRTPTRRMKRGGKTPRRRHVCRRPSGNVAL